MRFAATPLLYLATAVTIAGSCLWAWGTPDFWEKVPLYPCAAATGLLAALAIYLRRRRTFPAIFAGIAASMITLAGTAIITLYRWEL